MMPLWSWILIWTVLVLGLLGMLAFFAVTLFKKLMRATDALGTLGAQVSALDTNVSELQAPSLRPAIFENKDVLGYQYEVDRHARAQRRQRRRDALVNRGKLLGTPSDQRMDDHAR